MNWARKKQLQTNGDESIPDNDHDLLIKMYTDLCWVRKILGNHLSHHWAITALSLGTALSAIVTIVVVLLNK